MQIHLDSFGASLRVKDGMFWVKPRHHAGKAFAPQFVRSITITKGINVSSNALLLAIEHGVPVLVVNGIGHLEGMMWQGQYGSTSIIRKGQLIFSQSAKGLRWCIQGIVRKIELQRQLLVRLAERSGAFADEERREVRQAIVIIQGQRLKLEELGRKVHSVELDGEVIRGIEGTASRFYFQWLSKSLPAAFQFERRSRRPSLDAFNTLLNYGYGVLYAQVYVALVKAGLDPHVGILHADGYNRPSLVYDAIEAYRVWVDRVVWELCRASEIDPVSDFVQRSGTEGLWLDTSGKRKMVRALDAFFNNTVLVNGKDVKRYTVLDINAQQLALQAKNFIK